MVDTCGWDMSALERQFRVLSVGAGFMLAASSGVAAESDVGVGGYHDAALRAAQAEWLGLASGASNGAGAAGHGAVGPWHFAIESDPISTQTSFTPRFGGLGLGVAEETAPLGLGANGSTGSGPPHHITIGLNDTSNIAGLDVDWSAKAGVTHQPPAQAGDRSSFVVGGELAVSGVRFDAAYGEHATVLGVSGNRMTAGIAYGYGPIDARIGYSVVGAQDETAASLVTLGSRLTLQPGLILQGDLAYAKEQNSGNAATAGVVSLRFNF